MLFGAGFENTKESRNLRKNEIVLFDAPSCAFVEQYSLKRSKQFETLDLQPGSRKRNSDVCVTNTGSHFIPWRWAIFGERLEVNLEKSISILTGIVLSSREFGTTTFLPMSDDQCAKGPAIFLDE